MSRTPIRYPIPPSLNRIEDEQHEVPLRTWERWVREHDARLMPALP